MWQRQRSRVHSKWTGQPLPHQGRKRRVEATFERNAQQHHCGIGIEILLPRLVLIVSFPGIEEADEIGESVFPSVPVLVLPRRARQAGGVARELAERHPADVGAMLQLGDVLGNRIIERKLAPLDRLRQQCGRKQFADGAEIEDGVGRDRAVPGPIGIAEVEECDFAVDPDRHGDTTVAVVRHYRPDFFRNDLLDVDRGLGAHDRRASDNRQQKSDQGDDERPQLFSRHAWLSTVQAVCQMHTSEMNEI